MGVLLSEYAQQQSFSCIRTLSKSGYETRDSVTSIVFKQGKIYTLAAFFKSDDEMIIHLKAELMPDPWTGYGNATFTTTNVWEEYHITTPVIPADVNPARITFQFADKVGEFWIDGVRFYPGEYVPTEIEGQQQIAVATGNKLATTWGNVKAQD